MSVEGIDFAWSKPSPAQVRAVGGHWIAGYFSTDASKNLNRSNIPGYLAAGLGVVTVWETTAGRATAGYAAGVADARAAEAERIAAGLPGDHVHYFAVDEDTSWASVAAYFDGAISVLGLARVGCYGGYQVIVGAHSHGIRYLWQTVAWSGGQWASYASIRQTGGTLLGGSADIDFSEVPDFGQTPRPNITPPGGIPMPLDAQTQTQLRTIMDQALAAFRGTVLDDNIWWWQQVMNGVVPKGTPPVIANAIADIHAHLASMVEKSEVPVPPVPPAGK